MSNKLKTSKNSEEVIELVHELLGFKNQLYKVARLALSVGFLFQNFTSKHSDINGKEFNEYTFLKNDEYYYPILKACISNNNGNYIKDEDIFGNQSIVKRLIDNGCDILRFILKESNYDQKKFLKSLYRLKYDQKYFEEIQNLLTDIKLVVNNSNSENEPIEEIQSIISQFLYNLKFEILELNHEISSSIIRIKIKVPIKKSIATIKSKLDDLKLHLGINTMPILTIQDGYLCFDVSRKHRETVYLSEIIDQIEYTSSGKFPIGKSIDGSIVTVDLADSNTPHLLIAGATGQGKSECLKSIIATLLLKNTSENLKLTLIDPKKVEFSRFKKVPHLNSNIITEVDDAIAVLEKMVTEMEKRYTIFNEFEVNSLDKYNKIADIKMPRHIVIFDEFADFILSSKSNKERIENSVMKLSAKARAAGIHLILSTQRPDKEIITGVIKSNITAKVAFHTSNGMNSQIILDNPDAKDLLGKGDMFFKKENLLIRVQGAYIEDEKLDIILNDFN